MKQTVCTHVLPGLAKPTPTKIDAQFLPGKGLDGFGRVEQHATLPVRLDSVAHAAQHQHADRLRLPLRPPRPVDQLAILPVTTALRHEPAT
jgi:hypothetical protein